MGIEKAKTCITTTMRDGEQIIVETIGNEEEVHEEIQSELPPGWVRVCGVWARESDLKNISVVSVPPNGESLEEGSNGGDQ